MRHHLEQSLTWPLSRQHHADFKWSKKGPNSNQSQLGQENQTDLLEFSGNVHVLVLGEQVHVPEAVDGEERQVLLGLAEVVQRVSKLDSVGDQKVDVLCGRKKNWNETLKEA